MLNNSEEWRNPTISIHVRTVHAIEPDPIKHFDRVISFIEHMNHLKCYTNILLKNNDLHDSSKKRNNIHILQLTKLVPLFMVKMRWDERSPLSGSL